MNTRTDPATLAAGVVAGDRRAVARALTVVEDDDPARLQVLVRGIYAATGGARILGITGSPGVGKSTLTNAIAGALRARDRTVGIIAVDPSSPFSGGALLGDRVRMQGHHADDGVYIRSMASRGHLGGLSFATPHAVLVLDAAGFDDVIIETVGVGQSEVDVASTADTTIVAIAPGMGDSIQAAKAGILEVADIFVVNKADGPGAGKLAAELQGMLEMGHAVGSDGDWWPPIVRTVAVRDEGIAELLGEVDRHTDHLRDTGDANELRVARARQMIREIALRELRGTVRAAESSLDMDRLSERVATRDLDPWTAAAQLLDTLS